MLAWINSDASCIGLDPPAVRVQVLEQQERLVQAEHLIVHPPKPPLDVSGEGRMIFHML